MLAVPEELHLDVPPALDVTLQVDPGVAERGPRLRAGNRDGMLQLSGVAHHAQPPPSAAPRRLDQHGIADPAGDLRRREGRCQGQPPHFAAGIPPRRPPRPGYQRLRG